MEPSKRDNEDADIEQTPNKPDQKRARTAYQSHESEHAHPQHAKGRLIPKNVIHKLTETEVDLLENVKSSCTDLDKIKQSLEIRRKYKLCVRLPEDMDDSTYYVESGLRKVYSYQYLYQSYAKRRWLGRKLKHIIMEEFREISEEKLKWRFDNQLFLVNGFAASFDHVIKDNDCVAHRVHRHELPVLATPIKIIHLDKDTLVIEKPPSVPIHACGRYRHNSIVGILRKEYNFADVKVVHRLDRLVSGVLLLALNSTRAHVLEESIKKHEVEKEYVCRVEGEFPLGDLSDDGFITVDQPLEIIPGKVGITVVLPNGKPSLTKFKRLNYNGKTSSVLCKPKSGRMHQIRVHLQYLGHPIVNDILYNCTSFGPGRGKGADYGGKTIKQLLEDVIKQHRAETWLVSDTYGVGDLMTENDDPGSKASKFTSDYEKEETLAALSSFLTKKSTEELEERWKYDPEKHIKDPTCDDCSTKFHDPPLRRLFLYLHALKYSGPGWSYESDLPAWAHDSWKY